MGRDRSRSMSSSSSGRGAQSAAWDGQSGYRIHVSDLAAGVKRKEIEQAFSKYGTINEIWVATNPPCFAFINYKHRSDAEQAIRDQDRKMIGSTRIGVSWARTRTYGSRNTGGRNAPFGSFRAGGSGGGGGDRRRSRSRSRSGSRHRKRRHSRSRSPDRRPRDSSRDRKRSRRTSKEKNGKEGREKSPSASRSRSRSTSRKKVATNEKRQSQSRGSSPGGKSPVADNRSPLIATAE